MRWIRAPPVPAIDFENLTRSKRTRLIDRIIFQTKRFKFGAQIAQIAKERRNFPGDDIARDQDRRAA
jgi:hypothetical protein